MNYRQNPLDIVRMSIHKTLVEEWADQVGGGGVGVEVPMY